MTVKAEARGWSCDRGLVKAKGFQVAIEIVVSR